MTLTHDELMELLGRLPADPENEVVKFKDAAPQFYADNTSQYVSALTKNGNQLGLVSGRLGFGVSNVSSLRVQSRAGRGDVEALVRSALSQALTKQQKTTNITNPLTTLRCRGVIVDRGTRPRPRGELTFAGDEGAQSEPPSHDGCRHQRDRERARTSINRRLHTARTLPAAPTNSVGCRKKETR